MHSNTSCLIFSFHLKNKNKNEILQQGKSKGVNKTAATQNEIMYQPLVRLIT
jgi:hypothetical protein